MRCEDRRQTLSMLVDGALAPADSTGLFAHLGSCTQCRAFFEALLAVRAAAKRDQEQALREADDLVPPRLPRPAYHGTGGVAAIWSRVRRHPGFVAAAALGCGVLLLVAGIAIGTALPLRAVQRAASPPPTPPGSRAEAAPTVVYVCSMPEYEVLAKPLRASD